MIPHGTVVRQNFETMYKNKKKNTSAENVQLQVDTGSSAATAQANRFFFSLVGSQASLASTGASCPNAEKVI